MLVALFLPWYSTGSADLTAWQAMTVDDVILALTAILAIAGAFVVGSTRLSSMSVAATSLAIMPAVVGLLVTVYRLPSPPPPGGGSPQIRGGGGGGGGGGFLGGGPARGGGGG